MKKDGLRVKKLLSFDHMFDSGQSESHPRQFPHNFSVLYILSFVNYYGSFSSLHMIESVALFHLPILYRFKI